MKILITTGLYPPEIGGPATYTKMLEEELPAYQFEIKVAPYSWVRRYPKPIRHLAFAWKLIRESAECDAFYALDPISVGVPTLIAHAITRKPFLLRIAGDYAWEQGQQRFGVKDSLDTFVKREKKYHPIVRLLMLLEKHVADRAKLIIVPSEYMKGIVAAWGVEKNKIIAIHSALHPLRVHESRDEIREKLDYEGLVLVTAGRLVPWKGIQALITILSRVEEHVGKMMTLVIIGDGPLESNLKEYAAKLGVSEKVRFVGRKPKDALGAVIKGADIFVLNTAYEGMSHQLLEVMDLGVPIVTTAVGGNKELFSDGITGLLVEYNNEEELTKAIVRLATHTQLREQMVQHARLRVRDFSQEKVVAMLEHVLQRELLQR